MRKIAIKNAHPHAISVFAEDSAKDDYSGCEIGQLNHFEVKIDYIAVFPDGTPIHCKRHFLQGLLVQVKAYHETHQKGERVMTTSNINLNDHLINGQF